MPWLPLSVRNESVDIESYESLHEGIPTWLAHEVADWLFDFILLPPFGTTQNDVLHKAEQVLRLQLDWRSGVTSAGRSLVALVTTDSDKAIDLLDYFLSISHKWPGSIKKCEDMIGMLDRSGSAWKVASNPNGGLELQRRVDDTTGIAAEAEFAAKGNGARHLAIAWHKIYGRDTDASGGMSESIRAVEASLRPIVSPNDSLATLGKMIAAIRDKPTKWQFALGDPGEFALILDRLQKSQSDRHGDDDQDKPLHVHPSVAEAGLHLSITVVHWCRTGAFRISN